MMEDQETISDMTNVMRVWFYPQLKKKVSSMYICFFEEDR